MPGINCNFHPHPLNDGWTVGFLVLLLWLNSYWNTQIHMLRWMSVHANDDCGKLSPLNATDQPGLSHSSINDPNKNWDLIDQMLWQQPWTRVDISCFKKCSTDFCFLPPAFSSIVLLLLFLIFWIFKFIYLVFLFFCNRNWVKLLLPYLFT